MWNSSSSLPVISALFISTPQPVIPKVSRRFTVRPPADAAPLTGLAGLTEMLRLVVYTDGRSPPDTTAFAKLDLYHSDVTYEVRLLIPSRFS